MSGDVNSEVKEKILNWLLTGKVGVSSRAMACAVAGIAQRDWAGMNHPHDPDDLSRCLLLMQEVPEIRDHMDKVAAISNKWSRLVACWSQIERVFLDEVGLNWCKGAGAPLTYKLMRMVING